MTIINGSQLLSVDIAKQSSEVEPVQWHYLTATAQGYEKFMSCRILHETQRQHAIKKSIQQFRKLQVGDLGQVQGFIAFNLSRFEMLHCAYHVKGFAYKSSLSDKWQKALKSIR